MWAVSEDARVEVAAAAHPVAAAEAGRVERLMLELGRRVEAGDVLVELDRAMQEQALAEAVARREALAAERAALQVTADRARALVGTTVASGSAAVAEAEARVVEADAAARAARERAERLATLTAGREVSALELAQAREAAAAADAAALALRSGMTRAGLDRRGATGERETELAAIEREIAAMDGAMGTADATLARLRAALERRTLRGVTVVAGGHILLQDVDLDFAPGEHVAVVGPSGAGKSTFVGLLLGWHRAAQGEVRVDGAPLHGSTLTRLRRHTAWVDPEVHLWNRTFVDNLAYGNPDGADLGPIVRASDLVGVLQKLPDGLQQVLGEGGALLSGGEGQRARFGRALGRRDARLVILDEPFRGLDRDKRRALMSAARDWWPGATLLCVTHDVGETRGFPRVLVIEGGRVVEDAAPAELEAQAQSRYRALLDKEEEVRGTLWAAASWRRLRLEQGRVREHRG